MNMVVKPIGATITDADDGVLTLLLVTEWNTKIMRINWKTVVAYLPINYYVYYLWCISNFV